MAYHFPIARKVLGFARRARTNWLIRHQNPANYWIHMLGIPLALAGVLFMAFGEWPWGVAAFCSGYFLQWVGHRIEGNDMGELILVKRRLGLPVVPIAPQYQNASQALVFSPPSS